MKRLISALPFLLITANALAQRSSPAATNSPSAEDAAAAAAAATGMAGMGFACCAVYFLFIAGSLGPLGFVMSLLELLLRVANRLDGFLLGLPAALHLA